MTIRLGLMNRIQRALFRFRRFGAGSAIHFPYKHISGARFIEIGKRCSFGSGLTLIATDAFMGRSHAPRLVIRDGVTFGADAFIACTHDIEIGANVLASDRVFIGDSTHGYEDIGRPISRQPMVGEAPVRIGSGSFLGIGCVILPGVTLGKGCYVGANSVVNRSFGDHTVIAGIPARAIRRYDSTGGLWERLGATPP